MPEVTQSDNDVAVVGNELRYYDQRIDLSAVTAIKYGWVPIQLDMFTIGGRYLIELKTADHNLKMNFRYYLGLFAKRQSANFQCMLEAVWDMTVVRLLSAMIDDIENQRTVIVGNCRVNGDGILLKNFLIHWDDLFYQRNYNKLTINSRSNAEIWTNLYYAETDNVHVLVHFLEWKYGKSD
ncbi:MAG TPA: hypothetical protein VF490_12970 [Chryseosolibacter sp.]